MWTVDGETKVQQPVGMSAYRLEVDAHIVTGSSTAVNNLVQCVSPTASTWTSWSWSRWPPTRRCSSREERRMGVAVVDMGGGTSDLAVFIDNGLCHTVILDMGGNHLTNDLAVGCTARSRRPRISSCATARCCPSGWPRTRRCGPRSLARRRSAASAAVSSVRCLEARATEMLEIIGQRLDESGYHRTACRPGWCSRAAPASCRALRTWGAACWACRCASVRRCRNLPITGLSRSLASPTYATTVGLLLWGLHEDARSIRRRFEADHAANGSQCRVGRPGLPVAQAPAAGQELGTVLQCAEFVCQRGRGGRELRFPWLRSGSVIVRARSEPIARTVTSVRHRHCTLHRRSRT